uniref:Uncharacterized protein n=1 Tax=viral metagenome TaxID=1070528 RepID=A0A6C0F5T7_9ZZZZ|tara:strand:+ start:8438 stop:9217 length:780 start_codon:yes stop_codon:yes gene_type:complete
MKIKIKLIIFMILFIILCNIYLFTPQLLSDIIYGMNFGVMKFIYMDGDKNKISYTFNHRNYDGQLMAYTIQQELVKYNIEEDLKTYKFKPYQYLNSDRILQFSRFTSSVSYLLNEMITHQKRNIKVCIITSIRNKIKDTMSKGNFIKLAYFTIIPSDNIFDICSKLQTSVKNAQSKNYFKENTTLHEFFSAFYNVNYVFDSWRDLSSIYTKSNRLLIRQSTNKISEKDILKLKHRNDKKSFITLDFLEDKYIISGITNF